MPAHGALPLLAQLLGFTQGNIVPFPNSACWTKQLLPRGCGAPSLLPPVPVLQNWTGVGKHRGAQSRDSPHRPHLRVTGTRCPGKAVPLLAGGRWDNTTSLPPWGHSGFGLCAFGVLVPRTHCHSTRWEGGSKGSGENNGGVKGKHPQRCLLSASLWAQLWKWLPTPVFIILGTLQAILAIADCLTSRANFCSQELVSSGLCSPRACRICSCFAPWKREGATWRGPCPPDGSLRWD